MNDPVMQTNPSLGTVSPPPSKSAGARSLILYTIVALGFALFIRFFIAAPFLVDGASMVPTFQDKNYLVVDRLTYSVGEPSRGDVIVFKLPDTPSKTLIKRVIGLPGETVILNHGTVSIKNAEHPDGFELSEPYLSGENRRTADEMQITLSPDQYFVLGDNRHVSSDSRVWGTLPQENIIGRAFLRLYPLNEIGVFPGAARYLEE